MTTQHRRRLALAILLTTATVVAACSSDTSDEAAAPADPTAVAQVDGAAGDPVIDGPGTVRGSGLTEIDLADHLERGAVAVHYDFPEVASAYVLDENAVPLESILVGTLDSATGTLLIADLDAARTLQVDADGDWVVSLTATPERDLLDRSITGAGNAVIELAEGVVDVFIEGGGCPSGLEISSWSSDNEILSAQLFTDAELPVTITPPNFTSLINVRGPCDWILTPR